MKPLKLEQFVESAHETDNPVLQLKSSGALPPKTLENMRKLQRLNLLNDDVVLSLIGQAPIDPFGIFGALQQFGPWGFNAIDFTAMAILAKKGNQPVALMRIDLLSDDITFVVLKDKKLVMSGGVCGEMIATNTAADPEWLPKAMQRCVDEGMADQ